MQEWAHVQSLNHVVPIVYMHILCHTDNRSNEWNIATVIYFKCMHIFVNFKIYWFFIVIQNHSKPKYFLVLVELYLYLRKYIVGILFSCTTRAQDNWGAQDMSSIFTYREKNLNKPTQNIPKSEGNIHKGNSTAIWW